MDKNEQNINQSLANDSTALLDYEGTERSGNDLRVLNHKNRVTQGNFPSAKAVAFWTGLALRRKQPGNCSRCGKPHDGKFRQCDPCRVKLKKYKAKKLVDRERYNPTAAMAMIHQMRREVTKLREIIKQMQKSYRRDYQRAWKLRKETRKYADVFPEISKQEAATFSHAYEHR